jgi:hypothetical protein
MPRLTRLLEPLCLCLALAGLPLVSPAQPVNPGAASPQGSGNWKQLKPHEKSALAPLAAQWGELTETQRSKWLTIAQQFDKLTAPEQQVMQARMKEWVALSPVQRNQARLNFNTVQGLSKDEKKTRWDEYQALSEDEKRKLSAGALTPAKTAAPSRKPVASDRLVQPTVRSVPSAALPVRTPIDRKTLLPLPPAPPAAAAATAPTGQAPAESQATPSAPAEAASEASPS